MDLSLGAVAVFDGGEVTLEGPLLEPDPNGVPIEVGGIALTGQVVSCGRQEPFLTNPNAMFFTVEVAGQITAKGRDYALGTMELVMVRPPEPQPCDERPRSLDGVFWELTTSDPLMVASAPPEQGPAVRFAGVGQQVQIAVLSHAVDAGGGAGGGTGFEPGRSCGAEWPDASIGFDGERLTVSATIADAYSESSCSIDFTGLVTDCAMSVVEDPEYPTLRLEGEGNVSVAGQVVPLNVLHLTPRWLVSACEAAPLSLDGRRWTMVADNPLGSVAPENGFYSSVSGSGDTVERIELTAVQQGLACIDDHPDSSVSFDGLALSVEVHILPGDGEGINGCSLTYSGLVVECSVPEPTGGAQLLRVEGQGSASWADGELSLDTQYVWVEPE